MPTCPERDLEGEGLGRSVFTSKLCFSGHLIPHMRMMVPATDAMRFSRERLRLGGQCCSFLTEGKSDFLQG